MSFSSCRKYQNSFIRLRTWDAYSIRENKSSKRSRPISDIAIRTIMRRIQRANFNSFQATKAIIIIAMIANQIGIIIVFHLIFLSITMMLLGHCSRSVDLTKKNYNSR